MNQILYFQQICYEIHHYDAENIILVKETKLKNI